jgi:predicted GNAT family N-acyltransferase
VGRQLAAAAEAVAQDEFKLKGIVLHAQLSAEPFYAKLGYVADPPESFLEDGIMHVRMQKRFC